MNITIKLSEQTRYWIEKIRDMCQVHIYLDIEGAVREIEEKTRQAVLDLTGEYHPSGEVIEGNVVEPIEDETRLLQ